MDAIEVRGGVPLEGTVAVSGAKNAALPILASALLVDDVSVFGNVPKLRDIDTMTSVLRFMGAEVTGGRKIKIDTAPVRRLEAPYDLVRTMRASVLVLGPLIARYGRARVSLPGGCAIGARPIDQHLKGLTAMGATVTLAEGYIDVRCQRLRGVEIRCDMPTVTGTMNLMMAATLAEGRTTIENAAREPEVEELAIVLNKMGARVFGAGTAAVTIEGVERLHPTEHSIMADRIEAGTLMVAAAATRGNVSLEGCRLEHLGAVVECLERAGAKVNGSAAGVTVRGAPSYRPLEISTEPFPGFPTDMQAQFMVLCTGSSGKSTVLETIFENRFMHVPELNRMGANITIDGRQATIHGPSRLTGTTVMASDLRASAALIIAGLIADENTKTRVRRVYHLDRGYERIEKKLRALGAHIRRVKE